MTAQQACHAPACGPVILPPSTDCVDMHNSVRGLVVSNDLGCDIEREHWVVEGDAKLGGQRHEHRHEPCDLVVHVLYAANACVNSARARHSVIDNAFHQAELAGSKHSVMEVHGIIARGRDAVHESKDGMANLVDKELVMGRDMPAKMSASLPQDAVMRATRKVLFRPSTDASKQLIAKNEGGAPVKIQLPRCGQSIRGV